MSPFVSAANSWTATAGLLTRWYKPPEAAGAAALQSAAVFQPGRIPGLGRRRDEEHGLTRTKDAAPPGRVRVRPCVTGCRLCPRSGRL